MNSLLPMLQKQDYQTGENSIDLSIRMPLTAKLL
ncbi:hypothetical protein SAMN05444678_12064 [Sphingomonas sp. YR710]|nr:hypothetical protein SAMN05444678_12064 [Sphingomonas sp. YR710]